MINSFSAKTTYGKRAKLGLIVPPTNTVNEAEWQQMLPENVTVHVTRMPLHADTSSEEGKRALHSDIKKATLDLAQAGLNVIAYGCTAGSMVHPADQLSKFMQNIADIPCVTTAASILAALDMLGAKKISVATPYHDVLNRHEEDFLSSNGFEVVKIAGLNIGQNGPHEYIEIARTSLAKVRSHVKFVDSPDTEAILISCTDFPSLSLIPALEEELGKPIISSNQATFWATLRKAGVKDLFDGFGRLLRLSSSGS